MIDTDTNLLQLNNVIKTPGTLLREARQKKKFQQSDVAKAIWIKMQWVKDLEQDDYSNIPALIYVRGYLRAYARCVDISPDEVMASFDKMGLKEKFEQVKAKKEEKPLRHHIIPVILKSKRMINSKIVRWITVIFMPVLIVFVGIWWKSKKHILGQLPSVIISPQENLPLQQDSMDLTNVSKTNLS